jgi:hypothetical protein
MRQAAATLAGKKLSINKTTAVLVWLFGAWLSARAGAQMAGYEITGWASPPIQLVLVAMGAQWLLTRGQSPFWRWHLHNRAVPAHVTTIAIGSLTIDMLINAGGVWPLVQGLGSTDAWKFVSAIAHGEAVSPLVLTAPVITGPSVLTRAALALFIGAVIAGFSEYFWNLED